MGKKNIETYPYVVDKIMTHLKSSSYEASLFTAVKLSTKKEFKEASSQGFSILAGYF
jgi:c-di-GMP-related signal transduction protein